MKLLWTKLVLYALLVSLLVTSTNATLSKKDKKKAKKDDKPKEVV